MHNHRPTLLLSPLPALLLLLLSVLLSPGDAVETCLIGSTEEATVALNSAIASNGCDVQTYKVAASLYNTVYDGANPSSPSSWDLDGRGTYWSWDGSVSGLAISWLSGPKFTSETLNKFCCAPEVDTMYKCACRIAQKAGVIENEATCIAEDNSANHRYNAHIKVFGAPGVAAVTPTSNGNIGVTTPTWESLIEYVNATLQLIFLPNATLPNNGSMNFAVAAGTTEMSNMVQEFANGIIRANCTNPDSWTTIYNTYQSEMQELGGNATGCFTSPEKIWNFMEARPGTWTSADKTPFSRCILWYAMDANNECLGTGFGPNDCGTVACCDTRGPVEVFLEGNPPIASLEGSPDFSWAKMLSSKPEFKTCAGIAAQGSGGSAARFHLGCLLTSAAFIASSFFFFAF